MDIVIGAGATGLSYAVFSQKPCVVFEAEHEIGGYCRTVCQDGFVWDYAGHFFHFRNKDLEKMLREKMDADALHKCLKHTQINHHGLMVDYPFQKNIHQLDKKELIDCLYDLYVNEYSEYSNFKEMLYCKFGRSIAEKFLIPYNEKLYACDLNMLDADAMGRFFPYANKQEIIANFHSKGGASYNDTFTYSGHGAIEYINALMARLPENYVKTNARVTSIDTASHTVIVNGQNYHYDNLISTIPFPKLLQLTGTEYDESMFSWNKVLVFNLGFDSKGDDTINNWVYFADKKLSFYRIGYYDNIIPGDRMSLYIEIGFDKDADVDAEYWLDRVLKDLQKTKIVTTQKLISYHSVLMDPAYVHITSKGAEYVAQKKKDLEKQGVYSIGRYGSWTYCSIEDGMIESKNLSKNIIDKHTNGSL